MKVIPFCLLKDDEPNTAIEDTSQEEKDLEALEKLLPYICNDISILIARPFRFYWDVLHQSAGTDCKSEIYMSPYLFLKGGEEIGFGSAYHECGHILYSGYGCDILQDAFRQGGETRKCIMNLMLDRKDDKRLAKHAPGFAETLWKRLLYISTLAYREKMKVWVEKKYEKDGDDKEKTLCFIDKLNPTLRERMKERLERKYKQSYVEKEKALSRILKSIKPKDAFEDFFYACKWHKRPRMIKTFRAMKYLSRKRLFEASYQELLWIAERIHKIIGEMPEEQKAQAEKNFQAFYLLVLGIENGNQLPSRGKSFYKKLSKILKNYTARIRKSGINQCIKILQSHGIVYPGPISVGVESRVPVKKIAPNPRYAAENKSLLASVEHLVEPLVRRLRRVDTPSQFILHGREEGELDLTQTARIAVGLPGVYQETVVERDIDAEIHLAIDASGSMNDSKIENAKKIVSVFSSAIESLHQFCAGRVWAFSSVAIYDFGEPNAQSGFVTMRGEAGNSDTHMLKVVGTQLAKSRKRRKVLIVIGDDGPDSIELASRLSHQLLARGIITIHILVEVHGTPNIYPIELIYDSIEDCLEEFGDILEKIITNLK